METVDVLIVGAGIQGLSIAAHLVSAGIRDIVVLERGEIPHYKGATAASAAMVMSQVHTLQLEKIKFSLLSMQEYVDFEKLYGVNIHFHQCGSVLYTSKQDVANELIKTINVQNGFGIPAKELSLAELEQIAPFMQVEDLKAAAFCEMDGYIDQRAALQGYRNHVEEHAKDGRGSVRENVEVLRIETESKKGFRVVTNNAEFKCGWIVNATGPHSASIAKKVGVDLEILPTARTLWLSDAPFNPEGIPILEDIIEEWYLRPYLRASKLLWGVQNWDDVTDNLDDDSNFQPKHKTETLNFIGHRFPGLQVKDFVRGWAGIREYSQNQLPILGPSEQNARFINSCGWSGYGLMHAPVAGKLIAFYVETGNLEYRGKDIFGNEIMIDLRDFSSEKQNEAV